MKKTSSARRMSWRIGATLAVALLAVAGCGRRPGSLSVAGSTSLQKLAESLADAFTSRHPQSQVTVHNVDSAAAIQAVRSGVAQIGIVDFATLPPEADELTAVKVAVDGIAVIVHPSNTVSSLTLDQIRGIFSGRNRNWKDVGGSDHGINLVVREPGSGTRSAFEELARVESLEAEAVIQDTSRTVLETVARDENAIGYTSHSIVDARVRELLVDGQPCRPEDIKAGRYTLVRPIYLLTRRSPTGLTLQFVESVASECGAVFSSHGLIPDL